MGSDQGGSGSSQGSVKATGSFLNKISGGGSESSAHTKTPIGFPGWLRKIGWFALIAIIIIMVYTWGFGLGGFQSAFAQASTGAQRGGLFGALAEGATNTYNAIFNPEALVTNYGFESEVQKNANNPDLGVHIRDFKQLSKVFTGEPISLVGTISVSGFKDTVDISAFCSMNGNSGEYKADTLMPARLAGTDVSENKARFYPGVTSIVSADCYFPYGLSPDKTVLFGDEQTITTKQATMYVTYNFMTMASMKLYTLGWDQYQQVLRDPKVNDPFDYYNIHDPQRSSFDGTVQSIATDGPINLGVGTYVSQPFSENREYPFGVSISPSSSLATGNLDKLESLELFVPNYVYLQGDSEFGSSIDNSQCAFESAGQLDEEGFKIYTLKESLRNKLNNECSDENLRSIKLTKSECYNLHWKRLEFRCRFKIVPEQPLGGISYDYMRAVAKYLFTSDMPTTVTVYKMPNSAIA